MATPDHYKRTTCRLCGGADLVLRVSFGASPIGGAFVDLNRRDVPQAAYPLDLYQCLTCEHVQALDVVNPELVFADYSYFSGRTSLVHHFAKYADRVIARAPLSPGAFVVDVGSNDGSFLSFFRDRGMRVLGVDPAENVAAAAEASGVPTLAVPFDREAAARIRTEHGAADIVTANNVFAHIDDLTGVLDGVRTLLAPDGLFVFEVSYLLDVIDKVLLGAVFHEHLSYHAVKPLVAFMKRNGMKLIDVERVPIQGGSLICTAQHRGGARPIAPAVGELVALEDSRHVVSDEFFAPFRATIAEAKAGLSTLMADIRARGEHVAAYGAARGGTFITYLFDLGPYIEYIVDDDPQKIGRFSPGWHLPVVPVSELRGRKPEYVVVLAWVHSKAIVENNKNYLEAGGRFITFFPSIRVIDQHTAL